MKNRRNVAFAFRWILDFVTDGDAIDILVQSRRALFPSPVLAELRVVPGTFPMVGLRRYICILASSFS